MGPRAVDPPTARGNAGEPVDVVGTPEAVEAPQASTLEARRALATPAPERAPVAPAFRTAVAVGSGPSEPGLEHGATVPQLRRFIKSRAYVPLHELRRRFAINGDDDDVTALEVEQQRVFVGLPEREGRLLGELVRGGDVGVELSLDPITPIVVGVYPMRPIPRS